MGGAAQSCCKFHKSGHCKFGQNCHHFHSFTVCSVANCDKKCSNRHPKPCRNHARFGRCKFGSSCSYLHCDSLNSLLKKSKWIELTLTSSVSRALSHRKLLCYFMWITSFPGAQCCESLTNAFVMVQMIMHPQVIFIRESLYTSNHSTEPWTRRWCSRMSRRRWTFLYRKLFFVPLHNVVYLSRMHLPWSRW